MVDSNHLKPEDFINSIIKMRSDRARSFISKYNINTNEISDGQHTFGELYHARATLFAVFCYNYMDLTRVGKEDSTWYAWKSKLHHDGTMYPGYFIIGVTNKDTGKYMSYHYDLAYWDFFDVDEVSHAPEWSPEVDLNLIDTIGYLWVPNYKPYVILKGEFYENKESSSDSN